MCGIVAAIGASNRVLGPRRDEALALIAHRGPDDHGSWGDDDAWLGTRRLAIIDLSPGGHQPRTDPTTGVCITFNGEIYNYLELRDELIGLGHAFVSQSDTEVLLRAYLEWGPELLRRLNGMWAFLIWDPRQRRAFFARDRLGVKPFYYSFKDGALSVASEPKALLVLHPGLRRVDEGALYDFLAEGRLYAGSASFYAGIAALQPGHFGTFSPGDQSPAIKGYWTPPNAADPMPDYRAAVASFGELLRDSVRLRMRSDVPVGFTLSGGLDSSAVLQAAATGAASGGERLQAFTSVYETPPGTRPIDERRWAGLVADTYQVDLQLVPADVDDWMGVLKRIVWHMDGPGYSPAVFPLWKIMETARARGIPVLLEGQGADELLGGYPQYAALDLWSSFTRGRLAAFVHDYGAFARTFSTRMLTLWLARERASFALQTYRRRVGSLGTMDPDFVRRSRGSSSMPAARTVNGRLTADLTREILPGLLQYGDAISMAHSIESRLPFLDYRVVEFVSSLPSEFKVGDGQTKRILRDHLRAAGLTAIAQRHDKQGYPTPADSWLTSNGGALLRSQLLAPGAEIQAYCRPDRLERLIDHQVSGRAGAANHLYRLLTTQIWLRTCITGSNLGATRPGTCSLMRLLYVIHFPIFGGPHNLAHRLAAPLRERGWETTVLMPDEPGNAAERLRAGGVDVVTLPLHRVRATANPLVHLRFAVGLIPEVRAIRRLIRERGIDLVQIGGLVNPHAAIAARLEGVPVVWQLLDTRAPRPVAILAMTFVRRLADAVMSTGQSVFSAHPGTGPLDDRLVLFFPPVEVDTFRPGRGDRAAVRADWGVPDDAPVVGCVANVNPQKGIVDLVRAFALVRDRVPDARLVLVGAEHDTHVGYSAEVRAAIAEGGLVEGRDVLFVGARFDLERQLSGFDVFAFAPVPRGEGITTAVLEAMASGLPVVTTAVAGLPEAIDNGVSGRLVPPHDPPALSRAIVEILTDPGMAPGSPKPPENAPLSGSPRVDVSRITWLRMRSP